MTNLWKAYTTQKSNAKRRNKGFNLTYNQWLSIWEASEKLSSRGRCVGQYCMCRIGDVGSYEIGNVFIGTVSDNVATGNLGKVMSDETKELIGKSKLGKSRPDVVLKHGKPVVQLDYNDVLIKQYRSAGEASRETNIAQSSITLVCQAIRKTAGRFNWNYAIS